LITNEENKIILDIGTGAGIIANSLCKEKKVFLVGLDIDRRVFHKNGAQLFYPIIADAHHLPFKNEVFDVILFISCIEHLDHPLTAINEISRITKQNGFCITQLPNLQWLMEPHTKFPLLYFVPRGFSSIILKSSGYVSVNLKVTLKNVISWFTKAGFTNTQRIKVYHNLKIFKPLPWPLGWFLIFHKKERNTTRK